MAVVQQTDHAGVMLSRLINQLRRKPKLEKLLRAYARQFQEVETAFWQLLTLRAVDTAEGVNLDTIGKIVKQPRGNSLDDAEYRIRIKARVRVNLSTGTVEDIYSVFRILLGVGMSVNFEPAYPAGFRFRLNTVTTVAYAALYASFLQAAKAGGVYAVFEYYIVADSLSFMCEPVCCFLDGAPGIGDTSILVAPDTGTFPATGTLRIDEGLPNDETIVYTGKASDSFTLAGGGLVHAHDDRSVVALVGSDGLGFGDTSNPATGGGLAGAIGG